jgi:NADH oxidase (H2O-forming)
MKNSEILEITKDVKWIGILDPDIVTFDIVMETKFGTTYNSYFINAQKKAIIETAKEKFKDDYLAKVKQVTNPAEIEYIILNHTEPDHSGCLKHLLEYAPDATVVGSGQAINYLQDITGVSFKSLKVKDGDTLDLGNKTLKFVGAPNLHWPDSIYTYLLEDKLLFTCDSFGAHFCHEAMYDDKVGNYDEAFDYYFNVILRPFSKFMLKAIEKIRPLDIGAICPGHGPILRSAWKNAVDKSEHMAADFLKKTSHCEQNVLITYVSAYGYTKEMAYKIREGILQAGNFNVNVMDVENSLLGDLEEQITLSNAIIIGSPTINQNTLLPIYRLFAVINPIRDRGKLATTFGSYGWSGEAVKIIEANLKVLKLNVIQEGLSKKFFPNQEKATEYIEFGRKFGENLLNHQNTEKSEPVS